MNYNNQFKFKDSTYDAYQKLVAKDKQASQVNSLGGDGRGSSAAYGRSLDTNLDNRMNAIARSANDSVGTSLQDYINTYQDMIKNQNKIESLAKSTYSDALNEQMHDFLYGNEKKGISAAYTVGDMNYATIGSDADKSLFDINNDTDKGLSVKGYINPDTQKVVTEYLDKMYKGNDYFLDDTLSNNLKTEHYGTLNNAGSGNETWKMYETEVARRQAEKAKIAPENFSSRGAIGNVADQIVGKGIISKEFQADGAKYKVSANDNGIYGVVLNKAGKQKAANCSDGDVFKHVGKKYVKFNGKTYLLTERK